MWNVYIPLERDEPVADLPCVSLGHFYENYECIYCGVRFCATEHGGHSFEALDGFFYGASGAGTRHCYHCRRDIVNIIKDIR